MKYSSYTFVSSQLDYDSFGMITVGRSWSVGSGFRYGFNGMENDDEVAGNNNALDFGARIYDSRLGKFFSIDPKSSIFCWISPYSFAGNSPIFYLDYEGLSINGGFSVENNSSQAVILVGNGLEIRTTLNTQTNKVHTDYYQGTNTNLQGDLLNTSLVLEPNQRFVVTVTEESITNDDGSISKISRYSGIIYDMSDNSIVNEVNIFDIDGIDLTPNQSVTLPDGKKLTEENAQNDVQGEDWVTFDSNNDQMTEGDRIDVKFKSGLLNSIKGELHIGPMPQNQITINIQGTSSLRLSIQGSETLNTPEIIYPEINNN